MRALGICVFTTFVLGLVSGPLRTCVTHPGHGPTTPPGGSVPLAAHMAERHQPSHDASVPHREHDGCSCLGQCSLEHPPYLPAGPVPVLAQAPVVPRALHADHATLHLEHDRLSLPLARPPPAVV